MKQPTWSSTSSPKPRVITVVRGSSTRVGSQPQLSAIERQVIDVLSGRGQAMTIHQLLSSLDLAAEELEETLTSLVKMSLISRLNTVVPSYSANYPGVSMYEQ